MAHPAPAPQQVAVDVSGLCRRYGRRWALVNISFRVRRGTVLMLTGRNGSGKSTLLRVLATALRPDRGSACVEGRDIVAEREGVRRHLSLLSHHSYHYEALTALDNLRIAARFLGRDDSREALLSRLGEFALAERADDPVSTFSAGMRKRLALARTRLQDASVVLLDEPYAALDPPGFRQVDRLLEALRQRGSTVLMATHLLEHGAGLCDEGLVLDEGRLVWTGPAGELPGLGPEDTAGAPS